MTLEEIKQLIQVVLESGVAELEVTRGENRVRICRAVRSAPHEAVVPVSSPPPPAAASNSGPAAASAPAAPLADNSITYVKSPIVGTFYEAPSPDAPPFVSVGDRVTPGQVLCIIESMKLMNEIEAEIAGTIVGKLVENGSPVEYGEALFAIRPD
jgi:acetyl-CoA carboxylase biotin carboxyl carrier protein